MANYEKHKEYTEQIDRTPIPKKRGNKYPLIIAFVAIMFCLGVLGVFYQAKSLKIADLEAKRIIEADKPVLEAVPDTAVEAVSIRYIGEFKVTAYCSCEKCCGKWATDRPTDKDGNKIVYTASGAVAEAGKTVAVDTDLIPYGTHLLINGNEYIAQDTGSKVNGQVIDVYFDSHEEAVNFGCQNYSIYVIEEGGLE